MIDEEESERVRLVELKIATLLDESGLDIMSLGCVAANCLANVAEISRTDAGPWGFESLFSACVDLIAQRIGESPVTLITRLAPHIAAHVIKRGDDDPAARELIEQMEALGAASPPPSHARPRRVLTAHRRRVRRPR